MIKVVLLTLVSMVLFNFGYSKEKKAFAEIRKTLEISDINSDFIKDFIKGKHPEIAIECREGVTIPFGFLHKTKLASIQFNPNLGITAEKLCYIRVVGKKAYISEDLVKWEKPRDFFDGKWVPELKIENSKLLLESQLVPYQYDDEERE